MNRTSTLTTTLLVLLLSASASASSVASSASVADERSPATLTSVSGAYSLTFNVKFASPAPTGATIQCRARIVPSLAAFDNLHGASVPVLIATGRATAHGPTATCSVDVPFSWVVSDSRNGVALSYQVDAVSAGSLPVHAEQQIGAAYPASGGTTSMVFNLAF